MRRRTAAPAAHAHAAPAHGGADAGAAGGPGALLSLGSAIGNRRLGAALRSGVRVGGVHDAAEREAERTADRVAGRPPSPASVARLPDGGGGMAPPVVHDVLRSAGEPLRPAVRGWMESRLGADLGGVRVHTGGLAAESARRLGAAAWTVGPHVAFARGQYQPDTVPGRRLLAHELAHVVQQRSAPPVLRRQPAPGQPQPVWPPVTPLQQPWSQPPVLQPQPWWQPQPGPQQPPVWQPQPGAQPPVWQWKPQPGVREPEPVDPANEPELKKVFEEFEKANGHRPPREEREWARDFLKARGRPPEIAELNFAWWMSFYHDRLPSIAPPEESRLSPRTVPANEILPLKKGTQIRITHVLDKILGPLPLWLLRKKVEMMDKKAAAEGRKPVSQLEGLEQIIRAYPLVAMDLILSPDVAKDVTGVVEESGPLEVRLAVNVPAIPADGTRPALPAFKGTIQVLVSEAAAPDFDLLFRWSRGAGHFRIGGLSATRTGSRGPVVIQVPGQKFNLQVASNLDEKGETTEVVLQATDLDKATEMESLKGPVKLVDIRPLEAAPRSAVQAVEVRQARTVPASTRREMEMFAGPTLQYGVHDDRWRALLSTGVRMTFLPLGGLVGYPLHLQVDYAPRSSVWAEAAAGIQTTLPSALPVTVRLLGGVRGGSLEAPDGGPGPRVPALGPSGSVGADVRLSPLMSMQMQVGYFRNLLKDAEEKGPTGVPSVHLGSVVHF